MQLLLRTWVFFFHFSSPCFADLDLSDIVLNALNPYLKQDVILLEKVQTEVYPNISGFTASVFSSLTLDFESHVPLDEKSV